MYDKKNQQYVANTKKSQIFPSIIKYALSSLFFIFFANPFMAFYDSDIYHSFIHSSFFLFLELCSTVILIHIKMYFFSFVLGFPFHFIPVFLGMPPFVLLASSPSLLVL